MSNVFLNIQIASIIEGLDAAGYAPVGSTATMEVSPTEPVSPSSGRLWLNTVDSSANMYDGNEWVYLTLTPTEKEQIASISTAVAAAEAAELGAEDARDTIIALDPLVDADIGVSIEAYDTDIVKAPANILPVLDGSNLTGLSSGFADPTTTRGDIIIKDDTSTTRLAIGTNGQVLTSDGTDVSWGAAGSGDLVSTNNLSDVASASTSRDNLGLTVGTDVQAYDATNALTTDITYEALDTNGDVGTTTGTLAVGDHTHTGVYEAADATILKDADVGVNIQSYDADTTTAGNTFNGTSQLVQTDGTGKLPAIDGSQLTNIAGGDITESQITDLGTTIVLDSDIGSTVQAYDATIVVDADIGSTVQGYDADTAKTDVANYWDLSQRGDAVNLASNVVAYLIGDANTTVFTFSSNQTMIAPTDLSSYVGQKGIYVISCGSSTVSWSSAYQHDSGTVPSLAGFCVMPYYVHSGSLIIVGKPIVSVVAH